MCAVGVQPLREARLDVVLREILPEYMKPVGEGTPNPALAHIFRVLGRLADVNGTFLWGG